jgi:hypothetical protein
VRASLAASGRLALTAAISVTVSLREEADDDIEHQR